MSHVLRGIRETKNVTIEELSEDIGFDKSYISKTERGLKPPSKDYVKAFMEYFGIGEGMRPFRKFIKEQKEIAIKKVEQKYEPGHVIDATGGTG